MLRLSLKSHGLQQSDKRGPVRWNSALAATTTQRTETVHALQVSTPVWYEQSLVHESRLPWNVFSREHLAAFCMWQSKVVGRQGCVSPSFEFIRSLWSRQIPPNENSLVFQFVYCLENGTSCFGFRKDSLKRSSVSVWFGWVECRRVRNLR